MKKILFTLLAIGTLLLASDPLYPDFKSNSNACRQYLKLGDDFSKKGHQSLSWGDNYEAKTSLKSAYKGYHLAFYSCINERRDVAIEKRDTIKKTLMTKLNVTEKYFEDNREFNNTRNGLFTLRR